MKKNLTHGSLETTGEPLQFVQFWGDDEQNPVVEDDFAEDIYSDEEECNEKYKTCVDIYSDDQGYKYTLVNINNNTRYII